MSQRKIIFEKQDREWVGSIDNLTFKFLDWNAGDVHAAMLEAMPEVRIGFKSIDIGAETFLRYGPVLWMKIATDYK